MYHKIILGTANLEKKYGINKNFLSFKEFHKSLKILEKSKSNLIETSLYYKKSILFLKNVKLDKFKLILKINIRKKNDIEKIVKLKKEINIKKFYCIMIHDPDSINKKNIDDIRFVLKKLKNIKLTDKVGISIYNFKNIKSLLNLVKFDIVQIPFNIFDQRLLNKNLLSFIKKKKIEIHVRSIFFQGVILKKYKDNMSKYFIKFENFVKKYKYDKLFHCINFIKSFTFINSLVVGVNSHKNLLEIVKNLKLKKKMLKYEKLRFNKSPINSPYVW